MPTRRERSSAHDVFARAAAAALCATLLSAGSSPAPAQEGEAQGVQLEAAGLGTTLVGGAFPNDEMGLGATAGLRYRWPSGLSLGLVGLYAEPEDTDLPASDLRRTMSMGGAFLELRHRLARRTPVRPYVGLRAGWTGLEDAADSGAGGNGLGYGLVAGTELWAGDRLALRLSATGGGFSVSDYFGDGATTSALTWSAEAGVSLFLGSVSGDADGDGVDDDADACPATPEGAAVDPEGCPPDGDADGVADPRDDCPGTPRGAEVDPAGCAADADGDGVADGLDACPGTEADVEVDAEGCAADRDEDVVPDGRDACPDTPAGVPVDADGCASDGDGDGVHDGQDRCPDTPADADVDAEGCGRVAAGLDRGRLALGEVHFAFGSARLSESSRGLLDRVGKALAGRPELVLQVQGHTDSIGSDRANREVSWRRARAVVDHLVDAFPELTRERLVAVGMGETRPVADNGTEAGRADNRRVEFVVVGRRDDEGDGDGR